MVEVLSWGNSQDAQSAAITRGAFLPQPSAGTAERLPGPGFVDSLTAGFKLNNSVSSVIRDNWNAWSAGERPEDFDPSFNPRSWIEKNTLKDTQANLKDAIEGGLFDDVPGPKALQRKLDNAVAEKDLIQKEGGSWLGATLGALGGAVVDPLTYLAPEGKWWTTGSTAIRLGKSIIHAGAAMAPQEATLWSTQNFRDWQQSLLNVGAGSVLGGGVGFLGRAFLKSDALHPGNKLNPLAEDNLGKGGAVTVVPGEGVDVIPHTDVGDPYGVPAGASPADAGAAAAPADAPNILGGRSAVGKAVFGWTPAGRALQWTSDQARSLMTKLIDLGGVYTDTNRAGVATGPSAEDIAGNYMSLWHGEPGVQLETVANDLKKQLGTLGAPRLDPADFTATAQKILTNTYTPEAAAELRAKYGDQGAAAIKTSAEQFAAAREQVNALQEAAMKRAGAIRDDGAVDSLKGQLETLREQRKTEMAAHDQETAKGQETAQAKIDQTVKTNKDNPAAAQSINQMRRELREQLTQRDADRRQLAAEHDDRINGVQSELNHQLSLAPALGKDYGHAQLWEPGQIARDLEDSRSFLMDVLKVSPDENWLMAAHDLTPTELDKLRTTDPAKRLQILHEWSGEEHDYHLTKLQNSLEDARQREKLSKLDLNDTLRQLGVLKRGERQIEVREYGRYRDQLNADTTAAQAEHAAAREVNEPAAVTRAGNRVERLKTRADTAERAYQDARDARAARKSARQAVQDHARDIEAQRDLASQNVGQAKRAVRASGRATPLEQAIDEILGHLASKGSIPASALDAVVSEPGRFKARRLILTPEQKIYAAKRGWLRTDLPNILRIQDKQIAGHLGLREALDIGRGKTFESWQDVQDRIVQDYRRLAGGKDARTTGAMENESRRALKDLNGLKARLLGQVDPGLDRESWILWAQRQMRQYNFLRYAQGMLVSSIPDMGSFALQHRVVPMLAEHGREALSSLGRTELGTQTEMRRMLSAAEIAIHGSLLSERVDDDSLFRHGGIGAPGSLKNQITGKIDRAGEAMSHLAGTLSGLPQWDRFWKILSGLQTADDIHAKVGRYGNLTDLERTHLASLGVGEKEASGIQKMLSTHAQLDPNTKLWDPMLEKWYATREGADAARTFRIAIQRDMNRSRFWPGTGDRPLYADKWWGKLFSQFQNFSFAFTNRYLAQILQRGVHFKDLRAASSFAALMAAGAVTMTIKDASRGIMPQDRWNPQKPQDAIELGRELLDRSMLFGYISPYMDAAVTMSGLNGATRYEREDLKDRLLGVNMSLIGDAQRFASNISGLAQGQQSLDRKTIDKLTAIFPFASMLRMGTHTYDSVVNGAPTRNPYKK